MAKTNVLDRAILNDFQHAQDLLQYARAGELEMPAWCTYRVFDIMTCCWPLFIGQIKSTNNCQDCEYRRRKNRTWLRRWGDENGTLIEIGREGNRYYLMTVVPAWEPRAGEKSFSAITKQQAIEYDLRLRTDDPCLDYVENTQAKADGDPFFK